MSRRIAFGFLIFLALAMFARPLFRGEVLTFRDHADYFQPMRFFTAEELRHFRLPLWNPYSASGEPWLANPQTGVFYPPAWIFLVLPFATAYTLFLFLHIVLLGCGAYLLFSRFASARGAFIGAVALMLCGPTLSMMDISNNLTTFAWIPLVIWCAMSGASPTLSSTAIAMSFLGGEPFFAACGALIFAGVRTGFSRSGRLKSARTLVDVALTAFFLASVQLLPFLAIIAGTDRVGAVPREEVLRDSMTLGDWLRMAVPGAVTTHQHFIPIVYIGIVPALLALIGIFSRAARPWLVLLAVSVILSTGMGGVLAKLPLTIIRYPARVVPLGALAIIALAVIGFERAARAIPFLWLPMAAVALIVADLVPRIAPLLYSAPFDSGVPYDRNIGRDGKILRVDQPQRGFNRRIWISGYLNLFEHRFDAWTAAPLVSEAYTKAYATALHGRDQLNAMAVRYILSPSRGGVTVHRNPEALPMAYWRGASGQIVRASSLAFSTSAVHVVIDAPSDGVVVLTQQAAASWDVEVDGARAAALRDGVFRAVKVNSGHHAIAWRYHPRALMVGMAFTVLALTRMLLSRNFVKRKWHKKNFEAASKIS